MSVLVTSWRCTNGRCTGAELATVVNLETGWIERKCRKCGKVSHAGDTRSGDDVRDLRCQPLKLHKLGEASSNWRGTVKITCDRCKTESTITHASH